MELLSVFLLSLLGLLQMNDTTEMVFVGDAMQHGPQISAAARADGSYDYSTCFTLLEDDIKSAHYAVVNLECPLAGAPYKGYPVFSAPDDFARQLQTSGFDLMLTANNHILDMGGKGVLRTIATLDAMNIAHVGAYPNFRERGKKMPFVTDVNGIKVAFLSYTYGTNSYDGSSSVVVDRLKRKVVEADVKAAREAGAEVVCACVHWGNEYQQLPSAYQRDAAEYMKNAGVDIIIGSHPHVVQPMEMDYETGGGTGSVLVYSLGNFISNQNDLDSRGGVMAKVRMVRYNDRPVLIGTSAKLFFCQKPYRGQGNYKLIPQNLADTVRVDSKRTFEQFMFNSVKLFEKYNKNID